MFVFNILFLKIKFGTIFSTDGSNTAFEIIPQKKFKKKRSLANDVYYHAIHKRSTIDNQNIRSKRGITEPIEDFPDYIVLPSIFFY